jgi:hypothetical protein
MSLRAVRVRNLLLLLAIFATIVVAGCWDDRRTMQRVLEEGYPVLLEITGAQHQRLAPFAFDGWRPRFVEQSLSVDVKWQGRDGRQHVFRKVPVTDTFAGTIVQGEQVRLAVVPGKVLDDPHAVPVIDADAIARLASLQEWTGASALAAVAAWLGFGISSLWLARARLARSAAAGAAAAFPLRRTSFGFVALLLGVALTFRAWSVQDATSAMAGAMETTAEITSATTVPAAAGGQTHVLRLSWTDVQGRVRHAGPVPVSNRFWSKITQDGQLVVHRTPIRYSDEGLGGRPVLVDDPPARSWQIEVALGIGIALMVVGAGCLFSAARAVKRGAATQAH